MATVDPHDIIGFADVRQGKLHHMRKLRRALGGNSVSRGRRKTYAEAAGLPTISPIKNDPDSQGYYWEDHHVIGFVIAYGYDLGQPEYVDASDVTFPTFVETPKGEQLHVKDEAQLRAVLRAIVKEEKTVDTPIFPVDRKVGDPAPSTPTPTPRKTPETAPRKHEPTFPVATALEVAEATQKAYDGGSAPEYQTVNDRRLVSWGTLTEALVRRNWPVSEAFDAAFVTTMLDSVPLEERDALVNIYEAKVGRDPSFDSTPPVVADRQKAMEKALGEVVRPEAAYLSFVVEAGFPVWVWGPKGCGKSWGTGQVFRFLGHDTFLRLPGSRDTHTSDVFGDTGLAVEDGKSVTVYEPGALVIAGSEGRPIVFDELDRWSNTVKHELHGALDFDRTITIKKTGETYRLAAPVVANCNTVGLGESREYVDATITDAATRDRFVYLYVGPMGPAVRRRMLLSELGRFAASDNA